MTILASLKTGKIINFKTINYQILPKNKQKLNGTVISKKLNQ